MDQENNEEVKEEPTALTDHFYELNDENELVYSFPLMTKETLSGQIDLTSLKKGSSEEEKKNGELEIPELKVPGTSCQQGSFLIL